jgi:hypothetical protein
MRSGSESPEISFADPMLRRRLSQISKMTIQVVHDLLPLDEDTKMIFLSFRGELSRQYKINRMLIEDQSLMPAAFSLSVFNAPIALASQALGLKGGYSAVYPGSDSFAAGLAAAKAALLAGTKDELVFVYADEEVPPEYADVSHGDSLPFAFAHKKKKRSANGFISLSSLDKEKLSPQDFLKGLLR